ncbi:unnamed protein product [Lactuca saligna]|uniref:MULE transposase domain-containing protein n=1 Tax=Lactuca saligna TaxID=75948 RepID=A0AA36EFU8_LACSI|nr:unnamed protein product [Lactuca saligna]CAI9294871.1 unnamed protein product [Lactuca saligna]
MDLSYFNEFVDINAINEQDEINYHQTASVDHDFMSSDDDICSTDDDNTAIGKVGIIAERIPWDFPQVENIDQSIQVPDVTNIDQHLVIAGKSYWIPYVPNDIKPIINHKYPSDDAIEDMYRRYACAAGGSDAQMLNNRKENVKNFSFDYRVENKQLNALFWADETSKRNYKEFGDVVSFEATFRTNRYHMVFVPFTGIDNHKRCVTFGADLLSREDIDSYIWLLKSFLKAFGKQPLLVLSDQDPAMKKAIETVFPQSIHRLCMWHITFKLPLKVSLNIVNNPELRKKFNFLIWNSRLEVDEFEVGWQSLLNEYKLTDNKWLDDMHGLRHFWIPAFFKHIPLSGLMRTTSRSETTMEKQRFTQSSFDFKTNDKHPTMRTPFEIERNASMFYTRTVFRQVQNEMYLSMVSCTQISISTFDDVDECLVKEFINYIPSNANACQLDPEVENDDQWDIPIRESTYKLEAKFLSNFTTHEKGNKNKEFEKTLGVTIPTSVDIQNPREIRNKGSGTKKRMKSSRKVTIEKSKGSRCSYCRNGNDHDWRNCPVRKEDEKNNIFKERHGKKN